MRNTLYLRLVTPHALKPCGGPERRRRGSCWRMCLQTPKGFGIAPDGRYRYELPGFSSGTAAVS